MKITKLLLTIILLIQLSTVFVHAKEIRLSSLDHLKINSAGHGSDGKKMGYIGERTIPVTIGGQTYEDGVLTIAYSSIYIDVKDAESFIARVGVLDNDKREGVAVSFRILGDKKELFNSGIMRSGEKAILVNLDLTGIDTLILIALPRSKYYGDNLCAWADARFETENEAPEIFLPEPEKPYILTPEPKSEPRVNSPKRFGVRPGSPFLFNIAVTGKRPMTFSAKNLPQGLLLNPESGLITGQLDTRGKYFVQLQVKNKIGKTENTLEIVVGDTLSLTPYMGWNHWYSFTNRVTDEIMRKAADIIIESGMVNYGYNYVNIDDTWMMEITQENNAIIHNQAILPNNEGLNERFSKKPTGKSGELRDKEGNINANALFPDMKKLTDYIHSKGLKAGIYTSPGPFTCGGYEGSFMYEMQDAQRFAGWGFDLLKYDWCSFGRTFTGKLTLDKAKEPYIRMGYALQQQKRDIILNLCQYGIEDVWEWGAEVGGHSWRTSGDFGWQLIPNGSLYPNLISIGFYHELIYTFNGPGSWNDPDYILIGSRGDGSKFELSPSEQYTHMTLWCILAAPLVFSGDLTKLDDFTLNILCNSEVIEVNQDPLGKSGHRIYQDDEREVWAKQLEDGSYAVGLFNVGEFENIVSIRLEDLGLTGKHRVRDLWRQKDLGEFTHVFEMKIPRHGAGMVRIYQ